MNIENVDIKHLKKDYKKKNLKTDRTKNEEEDNISIHADYIPSYLYGNIRYFTTYLTLQGLLKFPKN